MKKYPECKKINQQFIEYHPIHWKDIKVKHIIETLTDFTANGSFANLAENVKYLTGNGYSRLVRLTDLRVGFQNEGIYVDEHAHTYLKKSELFGDEILIANVGAYAGYVCKMPKLEYKSTLGPNMYLLRFDSSSINNNFAFYMLTSYYFQEELKLKMTSTAQPKINKDAIKGITVLLPPLEEQNAISEYLNKKLTDIDTLISKKQKLIDLHKDERVAIINEAVTKGIYHKALYRKSKLDWLCIPEPWKEIRAKNLFYESNDKTNGDEELLSVSHYTGVTPRSEKNVNMFLAESYEGYKLCKKDDLVINTMWAWMGALGISEYEGIVSSGYGVYRLKDKKLFIPKYLNYLLRTPGYVAEYIKRSKGIHSSRWRLYPDEFFQITIICPPIEEQRQIIDYIQKETQTVDQKMTRFAKEIDLLQEYRTALISEVVTGKIDVREEVVAWT